MPKEFPFPLLKPQELRDMISTFLSVDVHLNDLEKPTPEFVQRVYEATLTLLVGSVAFDYASLGWTDFPELYAEAAPRMAFFARLQKLFNRVMVKDFCFEDLIRPDAARLAAQLSGLMNFLRFRGERLEILHRCEQTQGSLLEEKRALEETLRKKRAELAQAKAQHEAERREAEGIEPERRDRRQRCVRLSKTHDQAFTQQSGLRTRVNALRDDLSAAAFELGAKQREHDDLQDRIVQSPSKIEARISNLTTKLTETRDAAAGLLARDAQLSAEVEHVRELGKRVEEGLALLSQIDAAKSAKKEASKHKRLTQRRFEQSSGHYRQAADSIAALGRSYEQAMTQLQKTAREFEKARDDATAAVEEKREATRQQKAENEETATGYVAQGQARIQSWQRKTQELVQRHKQEQAALVEAYVATEDAFVQWCEKVQGALEDAAC